MKKNNKEARFTVSTVRTVSFDVSNIGTTAWTEKIEEDFKSNLDFNIRLSDNKESIRFQIKVKVTHGDFLIFSHLSETHFAIFNFDQYITVVDHESIINLPDHILATMYGLSYTHARALLCSSLAPTMLRDGFMLPIINPNVFIQNMKKESE
ncbi:MAG: hypothetical protein ISP71_00730 [Flavobacteriales bacterium]|nr:hypothetical protein [Flavobacteriales bacterium]